MKNVIVIINCNTDIHYINNKYGLNKNNVFSSYEFQVPSSCTYVLFKIK